MRHGKRYVCSDTGGVRVESLLGGIPARIRLRQASEPHVSIIECSAGGACVTVIEIAGHGVAGSVDVLYDDAARDQALAEAIETVFLENGFDVLCPPFAKFDRSAAEREVDHDLSN